MTDITPIEPEKSKEEVFKENPERFEDLKNCLLVVKRDPETNKFMVLNQSETIEESFIIEGYIKDAMMAFRNAVRVRASQTGIVKAGHVPSNANKGIINFIRNGKR